MPPLARWDVGSAVKCIAVSNDGTCIVSGSDDGIVRVWDAQTGALIARPLEGHTERIGSVAVSQDGTYIVSGSDDCTIRVWDVATGTLAGEPLEGHTHVVCSVGYSHDGTRIVSGSNDKTIRIWDAQTKALVVNPLKGHTNVVSSVSFSPDSKRIISGSWDRTIRIWDAHTGALIGEPLRGHTRSVYSVAFSHDNTRIVSGSWDRTIRIWDACTGAFIGKPLIGHTSSVASVAFSPNGTHIVSGSYDNTIRIWDTRTGAAVGELLKGHTSVVYSVKFLADGNRIVSGSLDHTISIWEAHQDRRVYDVVSGSMPVQEMINSLAMHGCADLSSAIESEICLSQPIAQGGLDQVYQARMRDGSIVAIKCPRSSELLKGDIKSTKRAMRECYIWSKLDHENIQKLLGIIMFQGQFGMVSPWKETGNLQEYIKRYPGVDRYSLCLQLANGVYYLHGIGTVHGGLKSANVLVSDTGVIKLTAFGESIIPGTVMGGSKTTKDSGATIRWMAPELFQPENDDYIAAEVARNTKTDIYALGMTMLEIMTGMMPYSEYRNNMGIYYAINRKRFPERPQELLGSDKRQTRMWELLVKCWDYDPETRPDASLVLNSLQSFAG